MTLVIKGFLKLLVKLKKIPQVKNAIFNVNLKFHVILTAKEATRKKILLYKYSVIYSSQEPQVYTWYTSIDFSVSKLWPLQISCLWFVYHIINNMIKNGVVYIVEKFCQKSLWFKFVMMPLQTRNTIEHVFKNFFG